MNVILRDKQPEIEDVMTFILEPEESIEWKAGQYGVYAIALEASDEKGDQRFFTIAAAPHEEHLQITTRITASSFKQALSLLHIGVSLELKRVGGSFTIEDATKNYAFIAGGIGITPFRSILRD